MGYITDSTDRFIEKVESERIRKIHKQVTEVRKSEKVGVRMMQRWEELAMERAEGRQEGREEGKADSVLELLSDLGDVPEDIVKRIRGQHDEKVLCRWLRLAARAQKMEDFRRELGYE